MPPGEHTSFRFSTSWNGRVLAIPHLSITVERVTKAIKSVQMSDDAAASFLSAFYSQPTETLPPLLSFLRGPALTPPFRDDE